MKPFGEVLGGDGSRGGFRGEERLDFGPLIEPGEQAGALLAMVDALVELIAHGAREGEDEHFRFLIFDFRLAAMRGVQARKRRGFVDGFWIGGEVGCGLGRAGSFGFRGFGLIVLDGRSGA
jgi:hypothetical protein